MIIHWTEDRVDWETGVIDYTVAVRMDRSPILRAVFFLVLLASSKDDVLPQWPNRSSYRKWIKSNVIGMRGSRWLHYPATDRPILVPRDSTGLPDLAPKIAEVQSIPTSTLFFMPNRFAARRGYCCNPPDIGH